jgi:hypothetical protein
MSQALEAYLSGSLAEAISLQRQILSKPDSGEQPAAKDFLLLAMFLHTDVRLGDAVSVLEDGLRLYPDNAELHENLGVCHVAQNDFAAGAAEFERALALGSESTNVLSGLCRALSVLGRHEDAVVHGRKALELKDRRFGNRPPLATVPRTPPPSFDPSDRSRNVIAYALWGRNPRYLLPLLENLRTLIHLFPAWTIRVYVDDSVPDDFRQRLENGRAQVVVREHGDGLPPARKLLWRFEVLSDPTVRRFLVRDADSLLTVKERVAVDAWLASGKYFHVMRDFHTHTDLVLAGMWGGVGGVLPPLQTLVDKFKPWRIENAHIDQDLLTVTAWSTIKQSCLIHDSVFTGCLGSVPFPPYGDLPKGHHIGQNAFIHFKQQQP